MEAHPAAALGPESRRITGNAPKHYQVVVCGAGPTGLMLANLLGGLGIRTLVVERKPSVNTAPRAVSIDDEALRTTQAAGLSDALLTDVMLDYGSHYFSPDGTCFAKVEPAARTYGFPRRNAFRQPDLEAVLLGGLDRFTHIDMRFGHALTGFSQTPDGARPGKVALALAGASDPASAVTCDFLAACDGGRSFMRNALGIAMKGSTFEQRWLILDLADSRDTFRHTRVLSNPARPGICLPGPHRTRRYEFMLAADETTADAETEDFSRRLLRAHGPDGETEIVRRQVYTFHARAAERWRDGRIFLLGDAAHLTPPFAGQGMNSGIRDAHNLAWKLAAVLTGAMPQALLESYERERRPHAWALIELAMAIGRVMVPTSPFNAWLMQTGFRLLGMWPPAKRYVTQMGFKPKPYYRSGFLARPADRFGRGAIGRMLPQPLIETVAGRPLLLDEILGPGLTAIAIDDDPAAAADAFGALPAGIARLCVTPRSVIPAETDGITVVRDMEGALHSFAGAAARPVLFVRPDRYIADAFDRATCPDLGKRLQSLLNVNGMP